MTTYDQVYKIDKDLPVQTSRISKQESILRKMKVGDSFLIPLGDPYANSVGTHMLVLKRRHGLQFKSKTMDCGGKRVWRIK
jgi:hypothetical protein|tara:strand:- start:356 stop:598 length:243 start_codon:yes stop_codon:yes gene_type:complete